MTSKELNIQFYGCLEEIFSLKKHNTWSDLSKSITVEKIQKTYIEFARIFNADIDRYDIIPKSDPKTELVSIYNGTLDGQTIINNIARYSLYSDRIIVFHPLQNANFTTPEYNPIEHPVLWRYAFVDNLYFYIVLKKWVEADLVDIIENPLWYDHEGHDLTTKLAQQRIETFEGDFMTPDLKEEHRLMMFEKFKIQMLGMPFDVVRKSVRESQPKISETEVDQIARELKEYEKSLPLYVDFGEKYYGSLLSQKGGGNLESIEALCSLTGAHAFTTQGFVRRQLELRGENSFWTKFGTLYSGLNFTYLDSVDTHFALDMRGEGRVSGLRQALRRLNGFLDSTELSEISDDHILNFKDEFEHEVKRSEQEWMQITDLAKKRKALAFFGSSAIGAVIDPTKIIVPAVTIPSSIAIAEYFKRRGLEAHRSRDPFSVFVDLKNRKPSFISYIQNCVF